MATSPTQHAEQTVEEHKTPLMLEDKHDDSEVTTLDMSSGYASVDLGPVVVNEDGTLSRITNWQKMTEGERNNTLRVLSKRNKSRLEALKAREGASTASNAAQQDSSEQPSSTKEAVVDKSSHEEL